MRDFDSTPLVLAVCGSLRDRSRTRVALDVVLDAAGEAGAETELIDLRHYDLPPLKSADGTVPDAAALRERVAAADGVALGTPNYHGSYSGALKNVLDYCGRDEFADTTVGLLEVAAGDFPGSAITHLRTVSETLHAWPLPRAVAVPDSHSLITDEGIADEAVAGRARDLGRDLVRYAGVADYPETVDRGDLPPVEVGTDD